MLPATCRFSDQHGFEKPNDKRALDLMDACAKVSILRCATSCITARLQRTNFPPVQPTPSSPRCMQELLVQFPEICIGFGESDEYSFVFHRRMQLYGMFLIARHGHCAPVGGLQGVAKVALAL